MSAFALLVSLLISDRLAEKYSLQEDPVELIAQLGHDNYQLREEATRALAAKGDRIWQALRVARDHPNLEISSRARALRQQLLHKRVESYAPFPCVDAFWYNSERNCYDMTCLGHQLFGDRLEGVHGGGYHWPHYQRITRQLVYEAVDEEVPSVVIHLFLAYARHQDRQYFESRGLPLEGWCAPIDDNDTDYD